MKKVRILFLFCIGLSKIFAQEANLSSGGNASGAGGSASFSVGQVVYSTNNGINGSVSLGVQQPYEIIVLNGLNEAKGITLLCSAYPNPAKDFVTVKVENNKTENLVYQLLDTTGKLLESKKSEGFETNILMSSFKPATYFLRINQDNMLIKTFKIIKR